MTKVKEMTKAEKLKMLEMRLDGESIREIADEFGVSRQAVEGLFATIFPNGKHKDFKCIFPGLKRWMMANKCYFNDMARVLMVEPVTFKNKAYGNRGFTMAEIKAILAHTGLTFEEAFGEEAEIPRRGGESDD